MYLLISGKEAGPLYHSVSGKEVWTVCLSVTVGMDSIYLLFRTLDMETRCGHTILYLVLGFSPTAQRHVGQLATLNFLITAVDNLYR